MHIEDDIVKFLANDEGIYLSKPDKKLFRKVEELNKRRLIEGLNNLQTEGQNKKFLIKR